MDKPPKRWIEPPKRVEGVGEGGSGERRGKVGEERAETPSSPSCRRLKIGV
jgi:hypothetical protein